MGACDKRDSVLECGCPPPLFRNERECHCSFNLTLNSNDPSSRPFRPAPAAFHTAMLTMIFIAGGIVAFINLPIEAFPDVSDTQVNVIALFPGRAPEEVEKQVTIPLETVLSGVPHSVRLFSHTQFGCRSS